MVDKNLNMLGIKCPMPVLKTKKQLKEMTSGQLLEVIADDPGALTDIPALIRKTGDEIVEQRQEDSKIFFLIKKA